MPVRHRCYEAAVEEVSNVLVHAVAEELDELVLGYWLLERNVGEDFEVRVGHVHVWREALNGVHVFRVELHFVAALLKSYLDG